MIRTTHLLALLPLVALPAIPTPETAPEPRPFHCQVPCGIYGDNMRIDMLMEDAATIEKGMKVIGELEQAGSPMNQLVRWIMTKDDHAQSIQETVASYWMAQRIKVPADGDEAAWEKYHKQLSLMHGITVSAMKCKQTTDPAHVEKMRDLAMEFSHTYFSKEDLEHIQEHHGEEEDHR